MKNIASCETSRRIPTCLNFTVSTARNLLRLSPTKSGLFLNTANQVPSSTLFDRCKPSTREFRKSTSPTLCLRRQKPSFICMKIISFIGMFGAATFWWPMMGRLSFATSDYRETRGRQEESVQLVLDRRGYIFGASCDPQIFIQSF